MSESFSIPEAKNNVENVKISPKEGQNSNSRVEFESAQRYWRDLSDSKDSISETKGKIYQPNELKNDTRLESSMQREKVEVYENSSTHSRSKLEYAQDYWKTFQYLSDTKTPKKTVNETSEKKEVDEKDKRTEDATDIKKIKKGGSYKEVRKTSDGSTEEVHHMPADSISELDRDDGPAIKMDKDDHHKTASYGSSKDARDYREQQKDLIKKGKFREALQMDIDDIRDKFGDKYDDAIAEMMDYVNKLEQEGKI